MKRWLLMALCLLLMVSVIPLTQAQAAETELEMEYPKRFTSSQVQTCATEQLSDYVDLGEFKSYLIEKFADCPNRVDISDFRIPETEELEKQIRELIWYRMPETFHVYALGVYNLGTDNYLTTISADYRPEYNTAQSYNGAYTQFVEVADYLLAGIEGNNGLTQVEKALLLHDRLAIWTEYNYSGLCEGALTDDDFNIYGILVNQKGVCQGYTMAYMYLLNRVGIENDYCDSEALNHAWNIVYLNGKAYHVDVTWDDPVWDRTGYVAHNNFLRSTEGMIATDHTASDYNTTPTDTTYDSYYWQKSNTAFQVIGADVYYISFETETLYKAEGTSSTAICSVADRWYVSETGWWSSCACLGSAGNLLLYSQAKAIYAVDPQVGEPFVIFEPDLSGGEYLSIFAFKYEKNYLVCDIASDHLHDEHSKDNQIRQYYVPSTAKYTVVFKDLDGSVISSNTYTYGQVVQAPDLSTKIDANGYVEAWDREITVCTGDAVYTKVLKKADAYQVTFLDWDGTVLSTGWYSLGDAVTAPADPSREETDGASYTFIGWDQPWETCTGDMTIRAVYRENEKGYTVVFLDWDGTVLSSAVYNLGDAITAPADPHRPEDGQAVYTFVGWDRPWDICTGDMTINAFYNPEYKQYKVYFVDWDGSYLYESNGHFWGDILEEPWVPERAPDETFTYTFTGWDKPVVPVAGDVTYYAQYDRTYIDYLVRFEDWDGSAIDFRNYNWGDPIQIPADPTRPGDGTYEYVFTGWTPQVSVTCNGSATYIAQYRAVKTAYTVVFKNWDGTVISTHTYGEGDAVTVPVAPGRPADNVYRYSFSGWDKTVAQTCTGNATYTAQYSKSYINYTVIFKMDDGTVIATQTYHYGDTVIAPADPTKAEDADYTYTFSGWDNVIVEVSGDAEYTATFKAEPKVTLKQGWIQEGGKWYYYEAGVKVKNAWREDSNGWCYLDANGLMVYNQWVKDSKGWCYVGSSGYMLCNQWIEGSTGWRYVNSNGYRVSNQWVKDSKGWCYLDANGNMVYNQWVKDSIGWCYVDGSGYMVYNQWVKDSIGWCYVDGSGYMVYNQWVKDSKGWCYVGSSGYMVYNQWVKDSTGWCYVGSSGYMVYNQWVKDSYGWCYVDNSGYMVYNQWVGGGSTWYYVGSDGYMLANTSRNIGGKVYQFDASGLCKNP